MRKLIKPILIAVLLMAPAIGGSVTVEMTKTPIIGAIAAATCAATRYTGWLPVAKNRSVSLEIFFDGDGSPATTAVTMTCQTVEESSPNTPPTTANGSGFDVHILSDSATVGTSTSTIHTWSNAVTADERWTWTVANLPQNWVNCAFACTAGDANDLLTVRYKQVSP